jgi:hypothetical protein
MALASDGSRFRVCRGGADGLCAVRQWQLHEPAPATLVTGLKHDVDLLDQVALGAAAQVLVCDLPPQRNRQALDRLLGAGAHARWFDHHATGAVVPIHSAFEAHLEESSRTCTSLLVDRHLRGRHRLWALVGAYGARLTATAEALAVASGLGEAQRRQLRRLGEAIDYAACGHRTDDVILPPPRMQRLMWFYASPLAMIASEPVIARIERQRAVDLQCAADIAPLRVDSSARVVALPDAAWSRRVSGCLAAELAGRHPRQAQAVLKARADGTWFVSVRAPPPRASSGCRPRRSTASWRRSASHGPRP